MTPSRCLVIHPGAVGDVLLALPALAHLGRVLPGAARVVAVTLRPASLLAGSPYVEVTRDFDGFELHRLFMAEPDPRVLRALGEYDAIVSWFGAGDPTYCAHLTGLGSRVVIARATPPAGSSVHASRHLVNTLGAFGPLPDALPPIRLVAEEAERAWAGAWLRARGVGTDQAVVLHPGAGRPGKVWPGFAPLARRLAGQGLPVVLVTGPADAVAAARLVADGTVAETMIARDLPLRRLAALLEAARVFVGNDSGPSHLAAALGCPTLVLFGPTNPAVWAPLGDRVTTLGGRGPGPETPWDGLTVERVEAALGAWLMPTRVLAG